jgi:hypothetical protein
VNRFLPQETWQNVGMRWLLAVCVSLSSFVLPSVAHAITRCEAIARAEAWVAAGVMYSWDAWYTDPTTGTCCYRSDCSGLVSAAWGLPPPGHTTYKFAGGPWDDGQSYVISPAELQPGDALNYPGNPSAGTGHIMLYLSGDFNSGYVEVIEEFNWNNPAVHRWRNIDPSIYLPIRFNGIQPCNAPPTGWIDSAGCDAVSGWTQDPDEPTKSIDVHLYFGGPAGSDAIGKGFSANVSRSDLCDAIGSCEHGYSARPPLSLFDGQPHLVHAYGIDSAGGANAELSGSPQTMTCTAKVPQGIRRHVQDEASLSAWKLEPYWSKLPLTDAQIETLAEETPLPLEPELVQADDGSPEVWVVDGSYKRHVPDPAAMAAWGFAVEDVIEKPAAELDALEEGPPWRAAPVLVQATSGKLDLIDDPLTEESGAGGAGTGGKTGKGGKGSSAQQTTVMEDDSGACACRVPQGQPLESSALWLVGVGALFAGLSRRRR